MPTQQVALVTGANRGIGLEVCRQLAEKGFTVLLGTRDLDKGQEAVDSITDQKLTISPRQLDVTDSASIEHLRAQVESEFGHLDVLVNNAGSYFDMQEQTSNADLVYVHEAFETNLFGAWRMCQSFLPLLRKSEHGRIVNVSSEAASFTSQGNNLTRMGGMIPAYGVTKAALNAFTVKLAAELKDAHILVNVVCPGTTATYPEAAAIGGRPIPEGAAGVVWAALIPDDGPTGGWFRDGKPLSW